MKMNKPILIAHVIHRFQIGGLENGVVNLINSLPEDQFDHVIICMTDYTDFKDRLKRDIPCFALHKKPGKDFMVYYRLWKVLRKTKPDIVHTRNINTLEAMLPALFAGVHYRIHGEHGRNMIDTDGMNKRYLMIRQFFRPLVNKYIVLSQEMKDWLLNTVKVKANKTVQIYNGVDINRFQPVQKQLSGSLNIGTVGRLQEEKDQMNLVKAFVLLNQSYPEYKDLLTLSLVGDGPLKEKISDYCQQKNVTDQVNLLGAKDDVPQQLKKLDLFVLPSLCEGLSNTILEAMASGLPVIATNVGGNAELVVEGETGFIVPPADPQALAEAINRYVENPSLLLKHGAAGRKRIEDFFAIEKMVSAYAQVYAQAVKN